MTSYHTRPVARLPSANTVMSISDVNQAISDAMIAHRLGNVGLNALRSSGRIEPNSVLPVQGKINGAVICDLHLQLYN